RSKDVLEFAGAAGAVGKTLLDAGGKALKGDFAGAAMAAAPMAVQNMAKALTMWNTGEYRNTRDQKVADADFMDGAMKFIGFQPAAIARESSLLNDANRSVQLLKNVQSEIAQKWAEGVH